MLEFLYTQTCALQAEDYRKIFNGDNKERSVRIHIAVYTLGDKYAIPALCSYAAVQFDTEFDSYGNDLAILFNSISCVYESTPDNNRTLQKFAVENVKLHARSILAVEEYQNKLLELVAGIDQFREDICLGLSKATFTSLGRSVPYSIDIFS